VAYLLFIYFFTYLNKKSAVLLMMMRLGIFLFLISAVMAYSQTKDSVYVDTTQAGVIDTVAVDTTGLLSTSKGIAKADTITPLYQNPFYTESRFISRNEINFLDYRYAGDFFEHFGPGFLKNYGFIGHPNELILYGTGDVGYFQNGLYLNNRNSGNFNLNLISSEMVDSVEIIPSPRGFLYGPVTKPVSVNFLERDILAVRPFTRIKYYEGPAGEAFIDAIFSSIIFKDFTFTVEIANRKVDLSYANSNFSIWQGGAHLKYLMSNKVNLTASYSYNDYDAGLNGGVNADSIVQAGLNLNSGLYDEQIAPVYFRQRRLNILQHNLGLRLFADPIKNSHTDLSLYYRFSDDEISNPPDVLNYPRKNKDKTAGGLLRQDVSLAFAELKVLAQYERTNSKYIIPGSVSEYKSNYFSLAPIISLNLLDSTITPSAYYKIQNMSDGISTTYSGLGFDVTLNLFDNLRVYGGYSNYKSAGLSNNVNTLELSAYFRFENLKLGINFINRSESFASVYSIPYLAEENYYLDLGTTMIGGNASVKLWKILLEGSSYYDLSDHNSFGSQPVLSVAAPKIKLRGGIYLDGYFFADNLNLKTGFAVNYNSKQRVYSSGQKYYLADQFVTVDFTLAGEIQKVAIAYFTWENLLDETYYIVPYYPMYRRGIRFGVAWELFN